MTLSELITKYKTITEATDAEMILVCVEDLRRLVGASEIPLPGSFEEYWTHRNSLKCPFNDPRRTQEDRHMLTWFHAISAWNYYKKDKEAYTICRDGEK